MVTFAILLNFNSASETIVLYEQLKEFHKDELEILVVDNNSSPNDKLKLKSVISSEELILNDVNLGYAGGNNIGIEVAINKGAGCIWILNPDIRIRRDSLHILQNTLASNKKIAAVGPRIIYRKDKDRIFSDGGMILKDEKCTTEHKNQNAKVSNHPGEIDFFIDYIDGSCILINVDAIKDVKSFPEEYFLYFEETDWCMKAKNKGYSLCVNSNSKVFNLESEKGRTYHFYMMRNRLLFAKKYHANINQIKKFYFKSLIMEFIMRFRGSYFKPFYFSRVKGFLSGYIKTI